MFNCQQMGIQPSEARALTWREYQARLWLHNDATTPEDQQEAEAPDAEFVARRMQRLADRGIAGTIH